MEDFLEKVVHVTYLEGWVGSLRGGGGLSKGLKVWPEQQLLLELRGAVEF